MQNELIIEELPGKNGLVGRIILNRPQALNALTQSMCEGIFSTLEKWEENPNIKFAIIKGAGEKAFCAGGDIRQIHQQKQGPLILPQPFFSAEYKMNARLFHFKKPYLALLNGIAMGGGLGVSLHGSYRIASEKLRLAMPETGIGFYPDVGVAYQLVRAPKRFGWYLGLTGNSIGAAEALHFGLCTHFVSSEKIVELEEALIKSADAKMLQDFSEKFPIREWQKEEDFIETIFEEKTLEKALEKLQKSETPFAQNTYETLMKRSPTSLAVTWELLTRAENLSFDEIIKLNYDMTIHFLKSHDFFEGVRAQIIDKDKNPQWQPPKISNLSQTEIQKYFSRS